MVALPSYRQVAASVAADKEKHPERYCQTARCLWRTGGGCCPRHNHPAKKENAVMNLDPSIVDTSQPGWRSEYIAEHGYNPGDIEHLIELWIERVRSTSEFSRGYYQGRFEEYASQNAVSADTFPQLWLIAARRVNGDGPALGLQC